MKTTRTLILGAVIAVATGPAALAAHNNPWATEDDVVLAKKHDANQLKSIGIPLSLEYLGHALARQTDAFRHFQGSLGGRAVGHEDLG